MQRVTVTERRDLSPMACLGKAVLPFDVAARVVRRKVRRGERGLSMYHCNHCQSWHVGHEERPQHWRSRGRRR